MVVRKAPRILAYLRSGKIHSWRDCGFLEKISFRKNEMNSIYLEKVSAIPLKAQV